MKHFFPFLAITLILCVLLHSSSILSVSAQQYSSFASAKSLSMDHSVSISLPANVTEYYYFSSLPSTDYTDSKYQLTLSETDSVSISAYDDQGSPVNIKQTGTSAPHWTGYIDNVPDNTRFFLVLHNQTEQDISLYLSVNLFHSATAAPKSDDSAKTAVTAKPDKKTTSGSRKTSTEKSEKNSKQKTKCTQIPEKASKPKTKHTQKDPGTTRQSSGISTTSPNIYKRATSPPETTLKINKYPSNKKTALAEHAPNEQATPHPTPEYYSDHLMNHSRSNSILSTHFFRMSAGYSISAFELLPINSSHSNITLETITPEKLSLQNNIIYAKAPGLAIIKIHSGNDITSCTIYIQESQERGN